MRANKTKLAAFFVLLITTVVLNSGQLYSQFTHEVGLDFSGFSSFSFSFGSTDARIYQSQNTIKFDIPDVNYAKILIYDKNSSIVRTYLFNNLKEGTYEISTSSGNIKKGKYNCVLQTEKIQESSVIHIN